MPGAFGTRHELQQFASATDQEMRRHAQAGQSPVIRMRLRVERIHNQAFDAIAPELARRQADIVDHQQRDRLALWALVPVGGSDMARGIDAPGGIDHHGRGSLMPRRSMR